MFLDIPFIKASTTTLNLQKCDKRKKKFRTPGSHEEGFAIREVERNGGQGEKEQRLCQSRYRRGPAVHIMYSGITQSVFSTWQLYNDIESDYRRNSPGNSYSNDTNRISYLLGYRE